MIAWQPPQPIEPALEGVRVTAAADGTVHLAGNTLDGPLTVRSAPPGGAFGPPATLVEGSGNLWNDVDAAGVPTVLLEQRDPGDPGPAYGTHPAHGLTAAVGAPLGPATLISTPGRRTIAWGLDVAASGAAVAAWLEEDGGKWYVTAALRPPGGAAFGAPSRVSKAVPQREYANVAVGERGDALVEWESGAYGTTGAHVSLARPGHAFEREVTLSPRAGSVQIAVGADGTAFAAAEHRRAFNVRAFVAPPDKGFRKFQTLPCQWAQAAAVGPDGRVLLACTHAKRVLAAWEGRTHLKRTAVLSTRRREVDSGVQIALDSGRALVAFADGGALKAALRTGGKYVTTTLRRGAPFAALLLPGGGAMVMGGTFSVRSTP